MTRVETLVVGGGPAGAAAAIGLASCRREVLLVERHAQPHHKVCGEFLSVETQTDLARLGIDVAALGAAPIDRVTVCSGRRRVSAALPFTALSVSRYRLDDALLRGAEQAGAQVRRGVAVRSVTRDGAKWLAQCDGGAIECRNLILATGKVGLRGIDDARDTSLVGLKMHLRLAPRSTLGRDVEIVMLDGGYAGLELVEEGVANLCLVLPRRIAARVGTEWGALRDELAAAAPALAARLEGAAPLFDRVLAVACPPGGHLHAGETADAYRVGDRLAHIPPFTGDGIAIALASAALAADHIRRGLGPDAYFGAARRLTAPSIKFAAAISTLAGTRLGRPLLFQAAALAPGLLGAIARKTRLPPMIHRGLPMVT